MRWLRRDASQPFFQSTGLTCCHSFNLTMVQIFVAKAGQKNLADYARGIADEICPDKSVATVNLLTFPRILGCRVQSGIYLCAARSIGS